MTDIERSEKESIRLAPDEKETKENLENDGLMEIFGDFGKYQKRIYFLLCLPIISCGLHSFVGVFLLATPDHRCKQPHEPHNVSFKLTDEIWRDNITYSNQYSKCTYYINSSMEEVHCDNWIYDDSKFRDNVVIEWDLVCSKSFMRATANSVLLLGDLIGSIVFGHLSDEIGRKPTFFMCLIIQLVFGVLGGLTPEYFTFLFSRIMIGAASNGVFVVAFVIAIEMVGPKYRLLASQGIMTFFSFGYMLTAAFAYYIDYWRYLQIAISLPGILFLSYWWIIPESIRFLLTKNRHAEAIEIIYKALKVNGGEFSENQLDKLIETKEEKAPETTTHITLIDLFRYPNLRKRSILIFLSFFAVSGTYYGLSWNTNSLGENHFVNFIASGAVELPAYILILFTADKYGRKKVLTSSMIISGIVLILTGFVPSNQKILTAILAMLGKMTVSISYGTIFMYATELFPTVIRNIGLGSALLAARIGGMSAPYMIILSDVWSPLPMVIFGGLIFVGGLLAIMLPETLNRKLPETISDIEEQ